MTKIKKTWEESLEKFKKKWEQEKKERKTLKKGDWVIYGSIGSISGFGMIEWINDDKSTCSIRKSEKQTDFHFCYWEVDPYVTKVSNLREGAERYYAQHRSGGILSSGYPRRDFEARLKVDWPSYYITLEEKSVDSKQ